MVLQRDTVSVYRGVMKTFQQALCEWLKDHANTQAGLAAAIGKSQVAVHRYAMGTRLPDAPTAQAIDTHTNGAVPFALWRHDFLIRSGLSEAAA